MQHGVMPCSRGVTWCGLALHRNGSLLERCPPARKYYHLWVLLPMQVLDALLDDAVHHTNLVNLLQVR